VDLIDKRGYSLHGLAAINVVLGKNGCGKSTLLRDLDNALRADGSVANVRYLTPERSGTLQYSPSVDNNIATHADWLWNTRRANQFGQFREQSVAQFRKLEIATLRRIVDDRTLRDSDYSFDEVITEINSLLDNIEIQPAEAAFEVRLRDGGAIGAENISSGEAELISLAIEVLVFALQADDDGLNILLMDEPDLHLHPDLQHRFARFVAHRTAQDSKVLLLATHSTSMVAALLDNVDVRVSFMRSGDRTLQFREISELHNKVLPVFGAHPLSQVFNESPVLLVEGEDDERVWQQAVRSSNGGLRLYPRSVGGVDRLDEFEPEVAEILRALYDNPVGYSLRDGDDTPGEEVVDIPPLVRLKLNCRAAENLLLSDDVLHSMGTDWPGLQAKIEAWLATVDQHQAREAMELFRDSGYDRRCADLKELRTLLVALAGVTRPWEVVVGARLAQVTRGQESKGEHDIHTYLGPAVLERLLPP
jgi:ABC-type multidrug transport system ATPase subunit